MDDKKLEKDSGDLEVYELGYHVLPTIAEEDVSKEVSQILSLISDFEGSVVSEGAPNMRQLAYDITKKVASKNLKFSKAYFGWVKFEMDRSQIFDLKKKIENIPSILRFIIVKTVKENTMYTPKVPVFKKDVSEKDLPVEPTEKAPASEEEIDKSIDELVIT